MHVPFVELRPEAFPLLVEFFSTTTGAQIWQTTVSGPGALRVPPLVHTHGSVRVRITYGDGTVHEAEASCDANR